MDTFQFVRDELAARKGDWLHIAQKSSVSYRALCNLAHSRNDSRMSTVTALADWLRANPRRREPAILQASAAPVSSKGKR
jgi:hypothetical protein